MENTTPEKIENPITKENLLNLGQMNFLRGMGNNQRDLNYARAMGEAQLRQMLGDDYQAPSDEEEDPMKIAGGSITENHYHLPPQEKPQPVAPAAPAIPPSAPAPSPAPAPESSAVKSIVSRMAPLALGAVFGTVGLAAGQIAFSYLNRTPQTSPTSPQIEEPTSPQTSPPEKIIPPEAGPIGGPIILPIPDGTAWELDLRKDAGR